MENNPVSQTLFRFVSLRNPELSNDQGQDKRFVFRSSNVPAGLFDQAVNTRQNLTKWQAMKNAAQNFGPALTEDGLKTMIPKLYEFSVWLVRNRSSFVPDELLKQAEGVALPDSKQEALLWNNLFYQVLTQHSFYAKEVIMQLLLAAHVKRHLQAQLSEKTIAENERLTEAKVVLPAALFVEDAAASGNGGNQPQETVPDAPNAFMQQQQGLLAAQHNLGKLDGLRKELQQAEKQYRKNYQAGLDAYTLDYDSKVKPFLDEYSARVEAARVEWVNARNGGAYNPENPYDQPSRIAQPELPKFNFQFDPEINLEQLNSSLSAASAELLRELTGYSPAAEKTMTPVIAESYNDLYALIDEAAEQNKQQVFSNTQQGTRLISAGGMLVPVNDSPYRTAFEYQLCPRPLGTGRYVFDISFEVPDASWEVASMVYHLHYSDGGNNTNGYYVKSRYGNTLLLASMFNSGLTQQDAARMQDLSGEIRFTNGQKLSFNIKGITLNQCFTGLLTGASGGGNGEPGGDEGAFIPKGFGFKQIGIADYKKVEQTVHCYVEGEVAHIENIMAREYKEKSTRRLRRSENTTTKSSETESEQLSDTTSTSRFDMQSEVAKVLQQSRDFSANASFSAGWNTKFGANFQANAGANYATHTSKDESTRQAVTEAKDVTARALDRVVSKVREERVEKIVEEFEENNRHGFDNREGGKHVVGVFRWVDKIYKNRIFNYGKRLMLEFMIPQPAKLHLLGMQAGASATTLVIPEDPRTAVNFSMKDASQVNETTARYWAGRFNAEIEAMPDARICIGKSFSGAKADNQELHSENAELDIPEGYKTVHACIKAYANYDTDPRQLHSFGVSAGNMMHFLNEFRSGISFEKNSETDSTLKVGEYFNKIPVSYHVENYHAFNIAITIKADLTNEARSKWQQETFSAIIRAYEAAIAEYRQQLAEEEAKGNKIKGDNPMFYRQIEQTILRKNCISYLVDQRPNAKNTYGRLMHNNANAFHQHEVNVNQALDDYTAFAKFLEQAFEWEIMSYHLYPFYWANKQDWLKLYQTENMDALFRSFLQSGLARVIVTVRPGFEAAVQHFLTTGQIWNGGQIPVIGDPLFLSIADEMREPLGQPGGKAWVTRVPTALTILQADSIGLKVEKALPCKCDDVADFEDPAQVPCGSNFELSTAKMDGGENLRLVENIDINNGNLQLTDDGNPRQVIAQISLEAIKRGMGI